MMRKKASIHQLSDNIACNKGQSEPAGSWLLFYKSLEPLRGEVSGSVLLFRSYFSEKLSDVFTDSALFISFFPLILSSQQKVLPYCLQEVPARLAAAVLVYGNQRIATDIQKIQGLHIYDVFQLFIVHNHTAAFRLHQKVVLIEGDAYR